jgi:uncharacterized protein YggE
MPDQVIVSAGATRELEPDRAAWTLIVRVDGTNPRTIFSDCAQRAGELADRLRSVLGDAGTVTTGGVTVREHQRRRGEPMAKLQARAELTASAPVERAGELAAAAMDAGADELLGPAVSATYTERIRDELLAEAVTNARRRADAMARAAGRRVGKATDIRDDRSRWYDEEEEYTAVAASAMSGSAEPPVTPRARRVSTSVQVVFELLD